MLRELGTNARHESSKMRLRFPIFCTSVASFSVFTSGAREELQGPNTIDYGGRSGEADVDADRSLYLALKEPSKTKGEEAKRQSWKVRGEIDGRRIIQS